MAGNTSSFLICICALSLRVKVNNILLSGTLLKKRKKKNFWCDTMYVEAHIFGDCILNRIPSADV